MFYNLGVCTYLAIYYSNQSTIKDSKVCYILRMHNWTNNNEAFVAQFLQKGITLRQRLHKAQT